MSTPTLSAYISAFNLVQNGFDYETALRRALAFFDEVVVAVNTSTDDTLARLQALERSGREGREQDGVFIGPSGLWAKLKIVQTDIPYTDVTFDGRVKDAALQACTGEVLVQMDLDEYVPLNQRALWLTYAGRLLESPGVDCFMIPTVDLWGSMDTIRADTNIGTKMRMHRRGFHRGVWRRAWVAPGKLFRTDMSDSGELIDSKGELVRAAGVVPPQFLTPATHSMLNGYPYTVHLGYANLDQRVKVNKAIWADHWTLRNGGRDAKVAVDKAALQTYPLIKHRLNLS